MCLNQQQRLASEAPEHREERHQLDREWHRWQREINPLLPLLQQPAVHSKMTAFHSTIGALQVSYCITCSERFPGLNVRAISPSNDSMECVHCKQNRHIPKIYSSENNMDPAPVPPELCIIFYLGSTFDAKQYIIIRESVDSLCRDDARPPIMCIHWKSVLTRERSCSKPFWTPSYPIPMFLYPMTPPR